MLSKAYRDLSKDGNKDPSPTPTQKNYSIRTQIPQSSTACHTWDTGEVGFQKRLDLGARLERAKRLEHVDGASPASRAESIHCLQHVDDAAMESVKMALDTSSKVWSPVLCRRHHDSSFDDRSRLQSWRQSR